MGACPTQAKPAVLQPSCPSLRGLVTQRLVDAEYLYRISHINLGVKGGDVIKLWKQLSSVENPRQSLGQSHSLLIYSRVYEL